VREQGAEEIERECRILKRDDVTGGWRELHNEETHLFLPNIRAIKSTAM
jgi:hypothetical protein